MYSCLRYLHKDLAHSRQAHTVIRTKIQTSMCTIRALYTFMTLYIIIAAFVNMVLHNQTFAIDNLEGFFFFFSCY